MYRYHLSCHSETYISFRVANDSVRLMPDLQSAGPTFKSTFKTSQEKFVSDRIQCKVARGWYIEKRRVDCGTQRCVSFNFWGHSKRVLTRSFSNLRTNASDSVNVFRQLSSNNASHSVSKIGNVQTSSIFRTRSDSWKCCTLDAFKRVYRCRRFQTHPYFSSVWMRLCEFDRLNTRKCCVLDAFKRGKSVSS
jgi:hypothetical protein